MDEIRWLVDERTAVEPADEEEFTRAEGGPAYLTRGRRKEPPVLALTLHDLVIHDVKKWFGAADLRLDALVVHGPGTEADPRCYQPKTFRFTGVKDGQRIGIDTGGLLLFYGQPRGFLAVSIAVSRDRGDSDDLAKVIADRAESPNLAKAIAQVAALATPAGMVSALSAAVDAAGVIASTAYQVIASVSGSTLGLYQTTWLPGRNKLGIGRHPVTGTFPENSSFADSGNWKVSFWYEIQVPEE